MAFWFTHAHAAKAFYETLGQELVTDNGSEKSQQAKALSQM